MGSPDDSDNNNNMNNRADLPPSYTEATSSSSPPLTNLSTFTTTTDPTTGLPLPTSPLTTHLRTLPARLRASQLVRATAQAARDLDLTTRLVPHVEAFLAGLNDALAASASSAVAELTLVPAAAVPAAEGWALSGAVERRREGEVVKVERVVVDDGYNKGGKGSGGEGEKRKRGGVGGGEEEGDGRASALAGAREAGFDEWGRFDSGEGGAGGDGGANAWWFRDEAMARRLAAYLRPEPNLERKRVQAAVVEKKAAEKEKSGWGRWGLGGGRKKSVGETSPVAPSPVSPTLPSPGPAGEDGSVKMTVRADEVTFRRENEFGIWESKTGWGIVVTVTVRR